MVGEVFIGVWLTGVAFYLIRQWRAGALDN